MRRFVLVPNILGTRSSGSPRCSRSSATWSGRNRCAASRGTCHERADGFTPSDRGRERAMTREDALQDVVTVVRLVPLGAAERASGESAIVAGFGRASLRTEGDSIFLVVRRESTLERLKVGDIVQWVAEPFGVVWLAERGEARLNGRVSTARPVRSSGRSSHRALRP